MNNHETRIEDLEGHAQIANEEMGKVHVRLATIETDVSWLKKEFEKIDTRLWIILSVIIVGILINIVMKFS